MSIYPPPNDSFSPSPPPPPPIHSSPDFNTLRSAYRTFGTAATLVSVGGFLIYVLLSSFGAGMMNQPLVGHLTIGLALGLCQFLLMGGTIWLYVRHMRRRVDPVTHRLRAQLRANEARAQAQVQAQQTRTHAGRQWSTW